MKRKSFFRSIKAVSPVIATIILIAISIVMSISIAYWALGIGNSFTRFEKIQITSSYVMVNGANDVINLQLKNTGTATATITNVMLNGIPYNAYTAPTPIPTVSPALGAITPGSQSSYTITIPNNAGAPWTPGATVLVDIQTAAGNTYPTTVTLP